MAGICPAWRTRTHVSCRVRVPYILCPCNFLPEEVSNFLLSCLMTPYGTINHLRCEVPRIDLKLHDGDCESFERFSQ